MKYLYVMYVLFHKVATIDETIFFNSIFTESCIVFKRCLFLFCNTSRSVASFRIQNSNACIDQNESNSESRRRPVAAQVLPLAPIRPRTRCRHQQGVYEGDKWYDVWNHHICPYDTLSFFDFLLS